MVKPDQKLQHGDWCSDLTSDRCVELHGISKWKSVPSNYDQRLIARGMMFHERFRMLVFCKSINDRITQYNYEDFLQLVNNTFKK